MLALVGDITRAFPHADIDIPMLTRPPPEVVGMTIKVAGPPKTISSDELWWVLKALYGYRKSSMLWQKWFMQILDDCGLRWCLAESTVFVSTSGQVLLTFHVDDVFCVGEPAEVEALFLQLISRMKLRETDRLAAEGDIAMFLNRTMRRTKLGFAVSGNAKLPTSLLECIHLETCRFVAVPAVKYSSRRDDVLSFGSVCGTRVSPHGWHVYVSGIGSP